MQKQARKLFLDVRFEPVPGEEVKNAQNDVGKDNFKGWNSTWAQCTQYDPESKDIPGSWSLDRCVEVVMVTF